jgi:hypothetical protein
MRLYYDKSYHASAKLSMLPMHVKEELLSEIKSEPYPTFSKRKFKIIILMIK